MAEKLSFGILGSGFIALTHAEAIHRAAGAELTAIAGGRKAGELAGQYGARLEPSVQALIDAKDIDAVVICTPHALHAPQAIQCLGQGKHVLVEKPMACSEPECRSMIRAAEGANRKLMVAHFQRYRAPNAAAKRAIAAGRIGRVRLAQQSLLEPPNDKPWQLQPDSRGFFLGYGVHGIDLLRWWFDDEVSMVFAACHRFRGNPTEDATQIICSFENGSSASLLATDCLPPGQQDKPPGAVGFSTLIIGDRGTITVDSYGQAVLEAGGTREIIGELPSWSSLTSTERIEAYLEQDADFIRAVQEDAAVPISGEEGMRNVRVALAAYESAEKKAPVSLQYVRKPN
ncbi:MAG: Gfo/Idh/MocA family oxidoreductase [Spirochaetales bacterium]|nr:Gfo/Idh/MocA family oxidoreductase [Spirochaetales bacterium]